MAERIAKTEIVRKKITRAVIDGKYACGETLPSIEQLAKLFSVSKNTVALALAELSQSGVLEIAHGKFTRVTEKLAKPHIMIYAPWPYNMEDAPFWGTFYSGIRDVLKTASDVTWKLYTEIQIIRMETNTVLFPERVDGIILLSHPAPEKMNLLLKEAWAVPLVSVYEGMNGYCRSVPEIRVDYTDAMRELIDVFRRKGVKRCAYAGFFGAEERGEAGVDHEKYQIFRRLATESGIEIPDAFVVKTSPMLRFGREVVPALSGAGIGMPDAIFLTSDLLAPGVCRALHDRKIRVPEDILVAGCDNMEIGSFLCPSLTTIELNSYRIGADAAEQMLARIRSGKPIKSRRFPSELIRREST